ncbi:MAG: hypothetical protein ACI9KE_003048 [Polyangiales bacterium]|jgi:hypothetical protein
MYYRVAMKTAPFRWLVILAIGLAGCGDDDRTTADGGATDTRPESDVGGEDSGSCTSDPECDDGFECTLDSCGVGGVCRYDTLDERCGAGETCTMMGCSAGCTEDMDCQNGTYCDGEERCVGGSCFPAQRAIDCDDGNECTDDVCSNAVSGCQYSSAAGCDAGVVSGDGGAPPGPFDPGVHYAGSFLVAPAPSLGCPPASYAIGSLTFRVVDDTLEITAGRFRLTQTPVPTGAEFNATSTADSQCSAVSLAGMFSNSDQLSAQWNAACGGICGSQSNDIVGERND